jgi:hypothetical protein
MPSSLRPDNGFAHCRWRRAATAGHSFCVAALTLLLAALPTGGAAAPGAARFSSSLQESTLEQVLARAATYVANLHKQLSGIVAEETFVQRSVQSRATIGFSGISMRRLKSDFLLVRLLPAEGYVEFRDIFEVDGKPVRDRQERLTKLFLQPSAATAAQIHQILEESARHNIGRVFRSINTPLLTLAFLAPGMQDGVQFRRGKQQPPKLADNPARLDVRREPITVPRDTWTIEFKEQRRPTFIKNMDGRDFPASGRFWIDPGTGVVLVSELVMENPRLYGTIVVNYQSEPLLGFRVPVSMDERHRTQLETVDGVATYGRFRQFQVTTSEFIVKPPGQ